jgi:hypothetical protein
MLSSRLRAILFALIVIILIAVGVWRFLSPVPTPVPAPPPGPLDVTLGVNKPFTAADMRYSAGNVSPPPVDSDGNTIGGGEKKLTGNVLEVKAWIEGRTDGLTLKAWAWQQLGVEFRVNGPAAGFRLARIHFKLDYDTQNSATRGDDTTRAEGKYSGAYVTKVRPAAPYEIVSVNQPGRLPIIARVPPGPSEFHQDAQSNVTVTETAMRLEVGRTYIAIIQAKAYVELNGEGGAEASAMDDPQKMVLKEIKLEWM